MLREETGNYIKLSSGTWILSNHIHEGFSLFFCNLCEMFFFFL